MKNEFDFSFNDQEWRVKGCNAFYLAKYIHSALKKKRLLEITLPDNLAIKFSDEQAWSFFYDNATFEEILKSVEPDGIDDTLISKMHEFDDIGCLRIEGDKVICSFGAIEKKILSGKIKAERVDNYFQKRKPKEVLALEIIRDHPTVLDKKEYAAILSTILNTARWSLDKKAADNAKKLLIDHLIPLRPGGKIPIPQNIKAVKAIMLELAKHLSKKCKEHISPQIEISREDNIDEGLHKTITKWASESNEFRINRLSINSLNTLVFSPAKYVNNLLLKHFRCNDLRTLDLS